ncbi:MAG: hypothetical protein Q8J90_02700 [Gallionella sp.]|nr:hypothetical protein [Gallionella sp.]
MAIQQDFIKGILMTGLPRFARNDARIKIVLMFVFAFFVSFVVHCRFKDNSTAACSIAKHCSLYPGE